MGKTVSASNRGVGELGALLSNFWTLVWSDKSTPFVNSWREPHQTVATREEVGEEVEEDGIDLASRIFRLIRVPNPGGASVGAIGAIGASAASTLTGLDISSVGSTSIVVLATSVVVVATAASVVDTPPASMVGVGSTTGGAVIEEAVVGAAVVGAADVEATDVSGRGAMTGVDGSGGESAGVAAGSSAIPILFTNSFYLANVLHFIRCEA